MAEPGLSPPSPTTTVAPVVVMVEPANTAKLVAVPRLGAVAAETLLTKEALNIIAKTNKALKVNFFFIVNFLL
jgi:hypothetical protein